MRMTRDKLTRTGSFMKPDAFGIKTALYAPQVTALDVLCHGTGSPTLVRRSLADSARGPSLTLTP